MINEHVCVDSAKLRLVPYLPHHVARYHEWMCDPDLLAATESEPLSLAEEEENQQSWLQSVDKLTFILLAPLATVVPNAEARRDVLARAASTRTTVTPAALTSVDETAARVSATYPEAWRGATADIQPLRAPAHTPNGLVLSAPDDQVWLISPPPTTGENASRRPLPLPLVYIPDGHVRDLLHGGRSQDPRTATHDATGRQSDLCESAFVMIGDCNLFLLDADELEVGDDDGASDGTGLTRPEQRRCFEVEVMVADKAFRRHGLAEEAVRLIMQYAISVLGATNFVAKILDDNTGSIRLFEEKLHFSVYKEVRVFHEKHLVRHVETAQECEAWASECVTHLRGQANPPGTEDTFHCRRYDASLESSMTVLSRLP